MKAWKCVRCGIRTVSPWFRLSDGFVRQRSAGGSHAVAQPTYRAGAWCDVCFREMVDGGVQTEMFE